MVILKASHIVKPAEPIPEKVMFLSECDQANALTHAPSVYFYKPTTHSVEEIVHILMDSLSKALVRFYPLAGRLRETNGGGSGGGRVELHCNNSVDGGALFVEAESDLTIDDFGDFCPTPELRSLIPSVDFDVIPVDEAPLLILQVTKLKCGGISLGTGISHVVGDGQSAGHFFTEWVKIARREKSDDHPFLDRTVLQEFEKDHRRILPSPDFFCLPVLLGSSDNLEERKKVTATFMLKLSKEQIQALKSKANEINGQDSRVSGCRYRYPFTRIEAVCAHIWKCVSLARGLKSEQETVLFVSVDFRNRVNPPLPKRYFGNAVIPLPVLSTVGELLSNPLSYISRKIRTEIENVCDDTVRAYLNRIKNIPDISTMRYSHIVGNTQGAFFGNPNLLITSWVGLPIFGANFGWGNEIFLGPGALGYDGRFAIIPSQNGDESFLVPLRLQVEHATAFHKYFIEEI
ncbi:OLC1v1016605C1 [Oldenlandia corymbosa var. corymbosa]|uniref:OLC1v1016605C1 n=1 Tax=Oldenlandia corymbosa var. corymbosa TaxID=529605 RepID=A0AAV1E5Q5_OLDCO|nr:OLC1v1016605C1 [Oldenlandia corymbosa var. corymbosa]